MRFDRFFDSIEDVGEYIQAQTGAKYFSIDFIKEHLKQQSSYTYRIHGIDISVYKRRVTEENNTNIHRHSSF